MTTQQYREVKRKAAVGERVRVFGHHDNKQNTEHVVLRTEDNGHIFYAAGGRLPGGYVVLEPIAEPAAPSPLSTDPLYAAFRQFVTDNADELRKLLPEINPPAHAPLFTVADGKLAPITPKLARAQVIAKATADVTELLRTGLDDDAFLNEDGHFHGRWFDVTFVVNREKRAVTALIYELDGFAYKRKSGGPHAKFTAKCSPADVFHAEIGKAIALRKALGLTVPNEYTDAPQPEKAEVGAIIEYDSCRVNVMPVNPHVIYAYRIKGTCSVRSTVANDGKILDDTDVDYSAVSAKGVAA
ncbi:hypothetical protein BSK66_07855 [Paenibacillus odorifer]|uniref:Uncharacterized protein n=1 Tax=Paenibacillus odorifer TaxID=189426 RepID=A0A1R0X2Y2_9BACL|nr:MULTISPECIES: hypothetical protein [Paenibacillus]ETT64917.1 hypothetical protein C171_07872 [Paenibacillus sp. FSL H8-237]OMD27474.1 hypothetical protein BJP51_25085 [Paenibacillus odorifer]OME61036.1 hypothetical protein BSK66_07855 [Paenibacillus odorifer]